MWKRFLASVRRFMYGRYGRSDQLNIAMLGTAVVLSITNNILALIFRGSAVYSLVIYPIFWIVMAALISYGLFRLLSRNVYKRQLENKWFQRQLLRITDRKNRYFRCPECRQTVRVPRGRGKISIRCPKCGEKFIKKT